LPAINQYEDIIAALVGMAGILFATGFLNTKENAPVFHKVFVGLLVTYVVIICIIASNNFIIGSIILEMVSLILVAFIFTAACTIMLKVFRAAKYFLIAWSLLLVSVVVFILKDFHLIQYNNLTVNSLQIGSGAEAILLSIALADRINVYRKEKYKAQKN
jgi:hypothetical protein